MPNEYVIRLNPELVDVKTVNAFEIEQALRALAKQAQLLGGELPASAAHTAMDVYKTAQEFARAIETMANTVQSVVAYVRTAATDRGEADKQLESLDAIMQLPQVPAIPPFTAI